MNAASFDLISILKSRSFLATIVVGSIVQVCLTLFALFSFILLASIPNPDNPVAYVGTIVILVIFLLASLLSLLADFSVGIVHQASLPNVSRKDGILGGVFSSFVTRMIGSVASLCCMFAAFANEPYEETGKIILFFGFIFVLGPGLGAIGGWLGGWRRKKPFASYED